MMYKIIGKKQGYIFALTAPQAHTRKYGPPFSPVYNLTGGRSGGIWPGNTSFAQVVVVVFSGTPSPALRAEFP